MRPSRTTQLGLICTLVRNTFADEYQDYDMDGSGECGKMIADGWDRIRDRLVQRFGFANMQHFMAVVERRTSKRWAYFGLHTCPIPEKGAYDG